MQSLPPSFILYGDRFLLLQQSNFGVLFERITRTGIDRTEIHNFEVWKISAASVSAALDEVNDRGILPRSPEGIVIRFRCPDCDEAEKRFRSLSAEKSRSSDPGRSPSDDVAAPQSADVEAKNDHLGNSVKMAPVSQEANQMELFSLEVL